MRSKIDLYFSAILIFFITLISGCVGKTKPFIPNDVMPLSNNMARIVLTREAQISGAGSSIYIVDLAGKSFKVKLVYAPEGAINIPEKFQHYYNEVQNIHKYSRLIGRLNGGETLIWDRTPGISRLDALWYDGEDISKNIEVKSGKTYFIHYTVRFSGDRWELKEIR